MGIPYAEPLKKVLKVVKYVRNSLDPRPVIYNHEVTAWFCNMYAVSNGAITFFSC